MYPEPFRANKVRLAIWTVMCTLIVVSLLASSYKGKGAGLSSNNVAQANEDLAANLAFYSRVSAADYNSSAVDGLDSLSKIDSASEAQVIDAGYGRPAMSDLVSVVIPRVDPELEQRRKEKEAHESDIRELIEQWRMAWELGQTDQYLNAYSDSFSPETDHSYSQWRDKRRRIVSKLEPRTIEISQLRLVLNDEGNAAAVEFKQRYDSPSHNDVVLKRIYIKKRQGKWKIARELAFTTTS